MDKQESLENSKYLKHGERELLAKKSGVSAHTVRYYINGKITKSYVGVFYEKLIEKRKEEVETKMSEID